MYFLLVHQLSIEKPSASQYLIIICPFHQKLFESRHSLLNEMYITLLTNDNCCGR